MSSANESRMKIIDRVVKLLAMANNTSFPEEAASAKAKAAELMAKENIDIGALEPEKDFFIETHDTGRKILDKIEVSLMNSIARFNGVKMYSRGKTTWNPYRTDNAAFVLCGRTCDLSATKYMYDVVKNQMELGLSTHRKAKGLKFNQMKLGMKNAFKRGFVYGVQDKIYELINLQNTQIQQWGLVPVPVVDLAAAFYESQNKTITARPGSTRYSTAGYEAGKNASIHKGVTKKADVLQIEG